jgi:hypothetical protein
VDLGLAEPQDIRAESVAGQVAVSVAAKDGAGGEAEQFADLTCGEEPAGRGHAVTAAGGRDRGSRASRRRRWERVTSRLTTISTG